MLTVRFNRLAADSKFARNLPNAVSGGDQRIVAIAGGADKTAAIRAVLNSGLLSGLITDEATATALLS